MILKDIRSNLIKNVHFFDDDIRAEELKNADFAFWATGSKDLNPRSCNVSDLGVDES